jgi:hypothetical protein
MGIFDLFALFFIIYALNIVQMPTQIKPTPAAHERYWEFTYRATKEPTRTAIPDAATRANAEPINTVEKTIKKNLKSMEISP